MATTQLDLQSRNALTERLLANARKPLEDTAELTGLDVRDVAERYARLFESHGWMSERQEERYLMIQITDQIEDAKKQLEGAFPEDYAAIAKVVFAGYQLVAQQLAARRKLVEEDIEHITSANARTFGSAYDVALSTIMDGLKKLHPDWKDADTEMDALKVQGLLQAKKMLDANVGL